MIMLATRKGPGGLNSGN